MAEEVPGGMLTLCWDGLIASENWTPGRVELRPGAIPRDPQNSQRLLRLQGADIVDQIGNPLLHLACVALADAREEWSPDRHVCIAVR